MDFLQWQAITRPHWHILLGADMNALSKDLRQRIFNYALTHSVRKTARIFHVSPNTVHLLKKLFYETGGLEPRPCKAVHAHAVSPAGELFLQALLLEDVDLTLEELCGLYRQTYGVRVGVATMHLTLKRMGYTYKNKDLPRSEAGRRRVR